MIFTIKESQEAFTAKDVKYLKVTGVNDKGEVSTKNIFNNLEDKWGLLIADNTVDFKMEKKGNYWNVVDIQAAGALVNEAVKAGGVVESVKPSKYKADPDKTASIERQVALKEAVKLCIGDKIELAKISDYAKKFADWLSQ